MHSGLLQQLAFGNKSTNDTTGQPNQSDINTQEGLLEQLALGEGYRDDKRTKAVVEFSDNDEVNHVPNATLAVVSDVYSCAHAIELDTHDVLTNVSSLQLFLELDAFSAGHMFEGMLNKDIDKDISVGLYQLYQPSTKGARLEGSSIPLSPINKWSDSGGDLDSVELHMTRAQICQVEASLTNEGNLKYDLGAAGCHLLGCIFNNSVVIDIRPEAIDTYKMVTKIPCLGSTHQLPAWSHGISSPGENEQQLELYRMSDTQWDPGLCAQDYKYRIDVDFDEHRTIRRPLEKALMLQIQQHLSANGTERTIVLTEIRLSWAPYVIRWCTVLEYRVFKYQKLCKLYKFKRDETSHGEDILHASVLNEFLTWMVWRCISQSDANCATDLVLENMIFGVLIIGTLCAGKRCFSLLINDSICI
jgi:hypothetical protein